MENNMNLQESIRKDLEAIDAPIVTEEQSNIYNVKVTSSHTGYVEITAESEDEAIDEALQYAYKYSVDYDPEEDITAEIVNDDSINEADEEGMSNEKEEQMHELLVFIIQTLDHEFYTEIQSTDNPIGLIRHKVDQVLNR
jgi:hypothetical protein